MSTDTSLTKFVRESLGKNIPRADIKHALFSAGWTGPQIDSALDEFSTIEFPVPVPKPKPYVSARDAFLYLILFSTLYSCVFNFGSLIFDLINHLLPEPSAHPNVSQASIAGIRWSLSSIVISFPIFTYVSKLLKEESKENPNKRTSKIRKQLTYITMFLASGTIICDLTYLVFNFLSGGLALRFLLKALTVGIIAGIVFFCYLDDLRKVEVATDE